MIEPIYLIIAFSTFIGITTIHIIRKMGIFHAGVYFFIYIYSIFSQIGYAYYPRLSIQINAYWGMSLFYSYFYFVFLSFLLLYILIILLGPIAERVHSPIKVVFTKYPRRLLLYFLLFAFYSTLVLYLQQNYDTITYTSVALDQHRWFMLGFKLLTIVNVAVYSSMRMQSEISPIRKKRFLFFFCVIGVVLSGIIGAKTGNRTDFLAMFLGISTLELLKAKKKKKLKKILIPFVLGSLMVVLLLLKVERNRGGGNLDGSIVERVLYKDYYAPSHILFAAIEYDYMAPLTVIQSNISNSLVKMNYPYLQNFIENLIAPDTTTRSASYAFFIFSEGYMAMGFWGFVYNGLVVFLGISLWKFFASTNDYRFNFFLISLFCTQLANIARSQSSYFLKDLYLLFPIGIIVFCLGSGINLRFRAKPRRTYLNPNESGIANDFSN